MGSSTETESGTRGKKACRQAETLEFYFSSKIIISLVTLLHALTCPSFHAIPSSDSSSSSSDESPARSVQSTAVPAPASQLLPSLEKDEPRKSFGIKVQNLPVRSTGKFTWERRMGRTGWDWWNNLHRVFDTRQLRAASEDKILSLLLPQFLCDSGKIA